jgi:hypothetical protein
MRITGRPKTSIYQHIRNLPLSEKRIQLYKDTSGRRLRQYALLRKGKSEKEFKEFNTWTPELVLLLAHLLFDGEIVRGKCIYNNRSSALLLRVERLMNLIYDFKPKRYVNSITGVTRLCYFNVALSNYLQIKAAELMAGIGVWPTNMQREFLRAFFDDEGCVSFYLKSKKKQIRGFQKDNSILVLVENLLSKFDIQARVAFPNEVIISGKNNMLKFQKEINFSPGVRINGNRSNSVWKEHLEKRDLLERAIQSFQT